MQATADISANQPGFLRRFVDDERWLGATFLAPAIIYIVALVGIPFVIAIAFSVSDVTVGDTSLDFVGLDNFARVIKTAKFQRALTNTFLFTLVAQAIIIFLANILAVVLSADFRGKWLARMLIMLPWASPISLGTIGWLWFLDSKYSPFDWILQQMNLLGPDTILGPGRHMNFLGREELAMASIILVHVWRLLPLSTVILMAGLTSIDQDLIDQAEVDGASAWRIHTQIKIPLIMPILAVALLFGLIFTFGDMVVVYILTRGGPVYYTQVLATWAYFTGIEGGALADGAAIALFLFPLLLVVAILVLQAVRRMEVT